MSIISICIISIISIVLSLLVKRYNSELSLLISIGASVVILLSVIEYVLTGVQALTLMLSKANINSQYVLIILKVVGICFVTEFACDCAKESGFDSLSSNIALAGKIIVLITAMPMFESILDVVTSLSTGDLNV